MKDQKITRRAIMALLASSALAACAPRTKRPNPVFERISFQPVPIPLGISKVEVTVRPRVAPDASPADADFVVPPEAIARAWPEQRIASTGGQNSLRYIIDDASAVSRVTDDGEVVVATVQVRVIIVTPYGIEEAGAGARVESEVRFTGFPNQVERQEALHRVSQDLAAKLDAQLDQSIRQNLGSYIRTG